MIQSSKRGQNRPPLFYFRFQMKIEFIPYIQQEIRQFIELCQQKLQQPNLVPLIHNIAKKRIKDIDEFFNRNWNDYRIQLILRSRSALAQFFKRNHTIFSQHLSNRLPIQVDDYQSSPPSHAQHNLAKSPTPKSRVEIQTNKKSSPGFRTIQKQQIQLLKKSPAAKSRMEADSGKKTTPAEGKDKRQKQRSTNNVPSIAVQPKNASIKSSSRQAKQIGAALTNRSNKQTKPFTLVAVEPSAYKSKSPSRNPQSVTPGSKLLESPKNSNQKKMTKQQFILYLRSKKNEK